MRLSEILKQKENGLFDKDEYANYNSFAVTKITDNQEQVFTINTIYVIYAHQCHYHKLDL